MKFDSTIFILDRRMAAFRPRKRKPDFISLEKLPQIPMIPGYYHLEESGEAQDEIREELRPYVKGFLRKQAVLLVMPDDAPVYVDQKYMRDLFIRRGAGTNTAVRTLESLCLAREKSYVAVSRSERLWTVTFHRGAGQPRHVYLPLSLGSPETIRQAIANIAPEAAAGETDVFVLDPEDRLSDYHELGEPLDLEALLELAWELAEKNQV